MDVSHFFGEDLTVDASGDIATSDAALLGQQRVLRRLLTNPGSYIWDLPYGAGLARFIGQPASASRIAAISRAQMFLEAVVARTPAPVVSVRINPDGTAVENIAYVDADTGDQVPLTLPIGQ